MRYFYDCEFLDDGEVIELISIGIVEDETGREYYAVNSDFDFEKLATNKWMVENVVANLPLTASGINQHSTGLKNYFFTINTKSALVKPKWVIANEVRDFIATGGDRREDQELWAYYASYDHVALAQLWGPMIKLPKCVPMWTHDLMQLIEWKGISKELLPPEEATAHNALTDARWNRAVYKALSGL